MKDGGRGRGAKLGSKSEGGSESESSAMVVFSKVLLPQTRMEHQTKRKEESYQGMWAAAIAQQKKGRGHRWEGLDNAVKGGGAVHHPPRLIWYYLAGGGKSQNKNFDDHNV
jgi:hypothetical protein